VVSTAVLDFLKKIGSRGGRARAKTLSPTERKSVATRDGRSRWSASDADQRGRIMAKVRAKGKRK